jgi:hypothetical protein
MAFIHTNFLTGNDSTGNGSTSTPYKTVYKAVQVAASSDFIKVAGGQWSSNLSGTFTFTQNSNIINTSVSQVGTVLVDDILSFADGQFGFDKFHIKVTAVGASTITTVMFWSMATTTVSDVRRIETYHYSSSTATAFETWSTSDVQPTGRTGITISGGWSTDFTTQGGWTVIRRTGQTITTANSGNGFAFTYTGGGPGSGGLGQWGTDLIWDRFMAHTANLFAPTTNATGSSFAIKDLAFVKGVLTSSSSFYLGIWQADPLVPSVMYNSTPGAWTNMNAINANQANNTDRPSVFECDVWTTCSVTSAGTANSAQGASFGSTNTGEGTINQLNLKLRTDTVTSGDYVFYSLWSNAGNASAYYKSAVFYCNSPGTFYGFFGSFTQITDLELTGPFAAENGFYLQGTTYPGILQLTGKTVDSLKPMFQYYQGTLNYSLFNVALRSYNQFQIKDSEGLKTLDVYGNLYFKTGGNLKLHSGNHGSTNSSIYTSYKGSGVLERPTSEFTVSFTLKVDAGAEAEWDTLAVHYGALATNVITQALTPTDEFATYTMTIDPADYADWSSTPFPMYLGIRSKAANIYNSEVASYCYIQSVTIA